ncbi:hypothetical protein [Streptomyces sp. 6N223]|uniref:hypothetical protein n=1 Tax=Streptomyces sp. 6N223 TaxID=3457412 RepID=UPI003FD01AA3
MSVDVGGEAARGGGGAVDLESVAEELYGLRPEEFTAARDQHVRAARGEGDRRLAARIAALRRPTLAAWAGNLLARTGEAERLLDLGRGLRQAQRELDGAQLRRLLGQQARLVGALAGQAARLAAEAGHPIGDEARREVEQTLLAVLADENAAREWAAGRLPQPLKPSSDLSGLAAGRDRAGGGGRGGGGGAAVADLDQARRRRQRRERERELERARRTAEDADAGRRKHADQHVRARDRLRRAQQRVAELARQLEEAKREEREARNASRETERAADAAQRRAEKAAADVERLERRDEEEEEGEGEGEQRRDEP